MEAVFGKVISGAEIIDEIASVKTTNAGPYQDVPVEDDPSSFIFKDVKKDNLYNFLREMEFNRLLSQATGFYGEENTSDSRSNIKQTKISKIDTKLYKSILNEKELDKLIDILNTKPFISIDTETSSLNPLEAELIGISFSYAPNEAYYIPLGHKNIKSLNKELVIKKIRPLLEDPSIKKVGQNIKYDFIVLKNNGIEIDPLEDTMLLSYVLDAGNNRHNMDTLSELHLGHKTISYKDVVGTGKKQLNFSDVNLEEATKYAAEDADVTLRLYNYLKERLGKSI